jgi:beta-galactosidase
MPTYRFPLLLCVFCFLLTASVPLLAQPQLLPTRQIIPLTDWKFDARLLPKPGTEQAGFDDAKWQSVTVPHTWNSKTQIQTHRAAWYRTHFRLASDAQTREIFVCFDGVGTVADVYLNGVSLGSHRGAYTRFVFDATAAAHAGDNVLAVRCDTNPLDTADCLPAGNQYQLYHVPGGIYRPAHLLLTAAVHVDPTDLAASGLFLTPSAVSQESADLDMKTLVRNDGLAAADVTVTSHVLDRDGKEIAAPTGHATLASHARGSVILHTQIENPHLWSRTDPYLYSVRTETSVGGVVTDSVTERTGLRFFRMTPSGFFLNGVLTPLRGVAKHQETEEHGSAVSEADLRRDWADLRDLGVNYVRLAHYPHAQLEYDLADEAGIVVWAENGHSNPAPPTETGRRITREMVLQNYNHPSICFWSIGNEAIRTLPDITTLEDYADTARAVDPTRLITYASNTGFYQSPALDFVAVNRYNGWYGGTIAGFDRHAAFYHNISETGAGGVISTHTSAAKPMHKVNKYEPEEYQDEVAESRCETVFRTLSDQVFLFTWWTFRDFSDPRYKGVNSKGLETFGGFRKDAFYLFQSFLQPQTPLVHLCGKTWFLRRRTLPSDTLDVKAYSNAAALTLTINGAVMGTAQNGTYVLPDGTQSTNVFGWPAALSPGRNVVTVSDGLGHSDSAVIYADRGETNGLVRNLRSSNPANPADFIPGPVEAEWPFYDNFDGTGDNTFHDIPPILQGASWITLKRPTVPEARTALTFMLAPDAGLTDIFLLMTDTPAQPRRVPDGYTDTGVTGAWRGNSLNLTPLKVYRRTVSGGQTIFVPSYPQDYLVLFKPHAVVSGAAP